MLSCGQIALKSVVLALAITAASTPVAGVGSGRLSGTVVDTNTGAPIPAVQIAVRPAVPSVSRPPLTAVTDAAGRYELTQVPAGTYLVIATKAGYVPVGFGGRRPGGPGGLVEVGQDQDRGRVDFQLNREAILAGRVADAEGHGLSNLLIKVSHPGIVAGHRQLVSFGSARSDKDGEYRVDALLPGDYYVGVSLFEGDDTRAAKYAPTFYPGSAEIATAVRLHLTAGQTTRISPITPLPIPWARLMGRLKSYDDKTLMTGALIMQPGDADGLSFSPDAVTQVFPDGRFTFDFVVPGHYIVRAQGTTGRSGTGLFASWIVTVEGAPRDEHTMTLTPGSDVSGIVRFNSHGARPPADLASIRVRAPLIDGTEFSAESEARVRSDATFQLTSVDAGSRLIRVEGLPAPWSLERVVRGGRDVTDVPLEIVQGQKLQDIQVVLTDVVTGLEGQVQSRAGVPLVEYLVVALPVNQAYWRPYSRYVLSTRTDWDGHYRLESLPPGAYRVAAVNDVDEAEIYRREVLDQLRLRSVAVTLSSGERHTLPLVVSLGQRSGGD